MSRKVFNGKGGSEVILDISSKAMNDFYDLEGVRFTPGCNFLTDVGFQASKKVSAFLEYKAMGVCDNGFLWTSVDAGETVGYFHLNPVGGNEELFLIFDWVFTVKFYALL